MTDMRYLTSVAPIALADIPQAVFSLTPSDDWDGSTGSGFDGSYAATPVDPTRTTAKPAIRPIVVPYQYFTDSLWFGVQAWANNGPTLIGGISKVRFYFEGSYVDVTSPTFRTLTHADGSEYQCLGYWVKLLKPAGTAGDAYLYAEAFPADVTQQNRVIGPYQFSPVATLHDYSVTVTPSEAESAGVNYQTVVAALAYMRSVAADNGLITITETLSEDITEAGATHTPNGYITITATAPVTFEKTSYTTDVAAQISMKTAKLCFRGSNITFDMAYVSAIYRPGTGGDGGEYWLDGCNFTNSIGRYSLWRKTQRPYGFLVEGRPWFTGVSFENNDDMTNLAELVLGCQATNCYNDFSGDGRCVIYNRIDDLDSTDGWLVDVAALDVTYTGGEATATFASAGTTTKTFTAVWGANSDSFVCGRAETYYTFANGGSYDATVDGQGYNVQDVADWLNSLPGWSATVLDDTRVGQSLGLGYPDKNSAFAAQNVKGVTLNLFTVIDLHGDFYQLRSNAFSENCIIGFNYGFDQRGQIHFISAVGAGTAARDFFILCNAHSNKVTDSPSGYAGYEGVGSAFSRHPQSNVNYIHNSMPTQRVRMDTAAGATFDAYCLIANNCLMDLYWDGAPDADLVMVNNVIDGDRSAPSGATGTLLAGDYTSKHDDALTGDFTPAGELLANLKAPVVVFDLNGDRFAASSPVGAVA